MKKELLISTVFAAGFLVSSFETAAQVSADELRAAAAAAAAPGAMPVDESVMSQTNMAELPAADPLANEPDVLPAPVDAPPREEVRSVAPVISTWNTNKATAVVLHPVPLRARPVASANGETVDAETRVRLESSTSNADGNWWFVTVPGIGGGWLLESEMGSPQH